MVRPRAHVAGFTPFAEAVRPRLVASAGVDGSDDLQDIRGCVRELVLVQRRIVEEVRRRAAGRETRERYDVVIGGLMRATASLLQSVESVVADGETMCWQCHRPIVPGRLAQPADVKRHMLECEPRVL